MSAPPVLDTDALSEVLKQRDLVIQQRARDYLRKHGAFRFSIVTRYEILKGLQAKRATAQIARFNELCTRSDVVPLSDATIQKAAEIWGQLRRTGYTIHDADALIAAAARLLNVPVITRNARHFEQVPGLGVEIW